MSVTIILVATTAVLMSLVDFPVPVTQDTGESTARKTMTNV